MDIPFIEPCDGLGPMLDTPGMLTSEEINEISNKLYTPIDLNKKPDKSIDEIIDDIFNI
jgi:hypothetical protein